jgi:hypothetical protein
MSLLDPAMFEERYFGLLPYSEADAAEAARSAAAMALARGVTRPNASTAAWDHAMEDTARTAPGSVVRGTTALLGSSGDAQALLGKGVRWAGEQLGFSPDHLERALTFARSRVPQFPTSDEIQSWVEGYTGEFHKPETRLGKYADSAVQFGLGGLVGGPLVGGARTLGGAAFRYGIIPGLTSEAAGQLTEGTQVEPWARPAGALAGIGVGAMTAPRSASVIAGLTDNAAPSAWSSQTPQSSHASTRILRDPPATPPRPIEADYPHGVALTDANGVITHDMELRPLRADTHFKAGRRHVDVPERGLTPYEGTLLAGGLARAGVKMVDPRDLGQGVFGKAIIHEDPAVPGKRLGYEIKIDRSLSPEQQLRQLAHEVGHIIVDMAQRHPDSRLPDLARGIKTEGLEEELKRVSRDLQAPNGNDSPRSRIEMVAEAVRAYLVSPAYLKTVAPKLAAAIREAVNSHPELSRSIQFNALTAGAAFGLGGAENHEAPTEENSF